MGRFHRHHHKRINPLLLLKLVLVALFLFFAYQYYVNNVWDLGLTSAIKLPLFSKVVEGYVYGIIVAVISFGIWWVVDYFN